MPFGDGTGPAGMGPMTGRAAGFCAGYPVPGSMNPIPGRVWPVYGARGWSGRGRGRGFRNLYYATGLRGWQRATPGLPGANLYTPPYPEYEPSPEQEREAIRNQIQFMEESIKRAQERIAELEKKEESEK